MKKKIIVSSLVVLLVLYIVLVGIPVFRIQQEQKIIEFQEQPQHKPEYSRKTTMKVPAIDEEDNGIMAELSVEVMPGKGRTLVDIEEILFWEDTQNSIRTAKLVAENITGIDLSDYDLIYSVRANASAIEGPSAGAAMAIATIASLQNKTINHSITITGYLKNDGRIGKVSGILPKAKISKETGMELFLVPHGQKYQITYEQERRCEKYVFSTFCRTETVEKKVDIEEEVGIRVEEVENVEEALKYFLT